MFRNRILFQILFGGVLLAAVGASAASAQEAPECKVRAPIRDDKHSFRQYVFSWKELKRRNIVMQQRDFSCGAASLATVLQYFWNDDVTETQILVELVGMLTREELRDRVENGLTLTDLRRASVRLNYEAAIGSIAFDKLHESKIPLIVGITVNEFDHFVVYRGYDGYYVYLADPIRGNVRTPAWQFVEQWQKNLVLAVAKPGDIDVPETSRLSVRGDEWFLGRMNEQLIRRRLSAEVFPLPRAIRP